MHKVHKVWVRFKDGVPNEAVETIQETIKQLHREDGNLVKFPVGEADRKGGQRQLFRTAGPNDLLLVTDKPYALASILRKTRDDVCRVINVDNGAEEDVTILSTK